ncbi:MAG: hypothetical protein LC437_03350 [Thiohalomonas sp.]|nr:hypothetical protein [Thiohalomonas sp.]
MTGSHNTNLRTSQKIEFSAKVLANQGLHGSVSQMSQEYGLFRPTLYLLWSNGTVHFNKR